MKHLFFIAFAFCLSLPWILAQDCPPGWLTESLYETSSQDVYYGSNSSVLGDTVDLFMTVYQPDNDTMSQRPLIMFAFGGGFVSGNRNDPIMTGLCERYAARGYVAATIDYRLYPQNILGAPDSLALIDANLKAISDMKAAIRYLRATVDQGNPFRINPDFVVVGGYSAGAFTALHGTYLDPSDAIPPLLDSLLSANGGYEGNTGDTAQFNYSSDVHACISFAGAMFDTLLIDQDEPKLFCLHGTEDETVPIGIGASVGTVRTFGSDLMISRAANIGLPHIYTRLVGAGHIDFWLPFAYIAEKNQFNTQVEQTLRDDYCNLLLSSENNEMRSPSAFMIYPNPAHNHIVISQNGEGGHKPKDYYILTVMGQLVQQGRIDRGATQISIGHLPKGNYILHIQNGGSKRFIKL